MAAGLRATDSRRGRFLVGYGGLAILESIESGIFRGNANFVSRRGWLTGKRVAIYVIT
jgi:hypothetical protein